MAAPINSFEVVESIRFFAQLVGTEGLSTKAQNKANEYIEKLLDSLEEDVAKTTATKAGLHIVKG